MCVKELVATVFAVFRRIPLRIIVVITGLVLYFWGGDIASAVQTTVEITKFGILVVFLGVLMLLFRIVCSCSGSLD